jgi:hypothetical protein
MTTKTAVDEFGLDFSDEDDDELDSAKFRKSFSFMGSD